MSLRSKDGDRWSGLPLELNEGSMDNWWCLERGGQRIAGYDIEGFTEEWRLIADALEAGQRGAFSRVAVSAPDVGGTIQVISPRNGRTPVLLDRADTQQLILAIREKIPAVKEPKTTPGTCDRCKGYSAALHPVDERLLCGACRGPITKVSSPATPDPDWRAAAGIPRSACIDLYTPQEKRCYDAIRAAINEVEGMGASTELTGIVIALGQCLDRVHAVVDAQLEAEREKLAAERKAKAGSIYQRIGAAMTVFVQAEIAEYEAAVSATVGEVHVREKVPHLTAEHDELYACQVPPERMTVEQLDTLSAAGWEWDASLPSWRLTV